MVTESPVRKILITGGMRSGKSHFALELAQAWEGKKTFLATAQASDPEMAERIRRHREERSADFQTVEEPVELGQALRREGEPGKLIVLDCLTLWINNLLLACENDPVRFEKLKADFLEALQEIPSSLIIVTNEVGWGIIADNALSRRYVQELGWINRHTAQRCSDVYLMVSGMAQRLKAAEPAFLISDLQQ